MKTNITLSLDTRRIKKDGTCPLVFRLTHFRKTTAISTGYALEPKYWNDKARTVKSSYKGVSSVTRLNNLLTKKRALLIDQISALDEKGVLKSLSVTELKSLLIKPEQSNCFFDYTTTLIEALTQQQRFGNARAYKSALGA
ncbi:MAG: site-specific integrase, partial [Flavobacteriaceae bacterium]|nr:site-specific integrase [Flavobacteriaceae bacterium]